MSLKNWFNNGWLKKHQTSLQEIRNLYQIVDRDLSDARESISLDWQFGIAYNAALKLCTILLYAEGHKPERNLQHFRTIQALPLIMGNKKTSDAQYLNTCRIKRNTMEYDYAGGITYNESSELIDFVETFKQEVVEWLKKNHPEIAP